jgi:hypothetical protein
MSKLGKRLKRFRWMFFDEKIFTVNSGLNRQDHRLHALTREEANLNGALLFRKKYKVSLSYYVIIIIKGLHEIVNNLMSAMEFCGLRKLGQTDPYFFTPYETIDTKYYKNRIFPFAIRKGVRLFGDPEWSVLSNRQLAQQPAKPSITS